MNETNPRSPYHQEYTLADVLIGRERVEAAYLGELMQKLAAAIPPQVEQAFELSREGPVYFGAARSVYGHMFDAVIFYDAWGDAIPSRVELALREGEDEQTELSIWLEDDFLGKIAKVEFFDYSGSAFAVDSFVKMVNLFVGSEWVRDYEQDFE